MFKLLYSSLRLSPTELKFIVFFHPKSDKMAKKIIKVVEETWYFISSV